MFKQNSSQWACSDPSVCGRPTSHHKPQVTPIDGTGPTGQPHLPPDVEQQRPSGKLPRSWTLSTPSGIQSILEQGNKVLDTVREKSESSPKTWNEKTSAIHVDSRHADCLLLSHSYRAYAAARLPLQYWLQEGTNEPDEQFIDLLKSVGVEVAAWEKTIWFEEEVAILVLFCSFADADQSGLHVVKAMVTLDKLGVHACRMQQELSNIAAHDICPWEQLLYMWYVWAGILEYSFGKDQAKPILNCTPSLWPIHDDRCNAEIWRVCRSGAPQYWCECLRSPGACFYRLWAWLNIDLRPVEVAMYDTIRVVHGTDMAVYFVFVSSVIRSLAFLTILVLPFILWNARTAYDTACQGDDCFEDLFSKIGRPTLALVLCIWSCHIRARWKLVYSALCHRWHIKESSEHQKILPFTQEVVRDVFRAYPVGSGTYPCAFRAVRTLFIVPCLCLCWLLIAFMLSCTFYFEMWIVYEWADCRERNKIAGEAGETPSCDGADFKYGFAGTLVEAMPGLLEGILFEIAKVFAQKCTTFVCNLQNWRTFSEYKTAYKVQVYFLEFISKFCVIGCLAFFFVPNWSSQNKSYWQIKDEDCADFFLTDWGPSCLQIRTPYELRLKLLKQSMIGCFIVAPLISILITCFIPHIFRCCVACGGNAYLRRCFIWRILLVAFYYEEDALGGCCAYVFRGKERPAYKLRNSGVALARQQVPLSWSSVARQGHLKAFKPTDGYIDLVLHINFIATFGVVFPLGAIINLLIVMFRLRGEVFMVLFEKQRRLNHYALQTEVQQRCIDIILIWQLVVAVVFNCLLLMLPFRQLEYWVPLYREQALNTYSGDLAIACIFLIIGFGFVLLVLKHLLHFLPMPALQFVQDWRHHLKTQQIDLDYALRRDCDKAMEECTALRIQAQKDCDAMRMQTQKECDALRQELKQTQQELAELRTWQASVRSGAPDQLEQIGKATEPEIQIAGEAMGPCQSPPPCELLGSKHEGCNELRRNTDISDMKVAIKLESAASNECQNKTIFPDSHTKWSKTNGCSVNDRVPGSDNLSSRKRAMTSGNANHQILGGDCGLQKIVTNFIA